MKRFKFTIIELLLVISIAGLMLTVAVPAFSRMLKGSASGIAVRELAGKQNAARAYAVANKTYVAVVFPGEEANILKKRHSYRSYRACEITINGSEKKYLRWIPLENWNFFPNGIIFGYDLHNSDPNHYDYIVSSKSSDEKNKENLTSIHDNTLKACEIGGRSFSNGSPTDIRNYIIFRPDGTTDTFPKASLLRLRNGKTDSVGAVTENSDFYYPLVIRFNGKVKFYNELVSD